MSAQLQSAGRRFAWCVRRELWENRSVLIAPPIAAGVVMIGYLLGMASLPAKMRDLAAADLATQTDRLTEMFGFAGMPIVVTMLVVAVVYCLGALYNERRDRSILFWKSLPVSDLTTVLAKVSIAVLVLPLVASVTIVVTQLVLLLLSTTVLLVTGPPPGLLWAQLPFIQMDIGVVYGLFTLALWYAPIYGWLLLVSSWAKRTPFLWAVSPVALCVVEAIAFHSGRIFHLLAHRLTGAGKIAFVDQTGGNVLASHLSDLDPIGFFTSAGLWIGLVVAAGFLAAAIWLRRNREPI